jgi:hypothetical protein
MTIQESMFIGSGPLSTQNELLKSPHNKPQLRVLPAIEDDESNSSIANEKHSSDGENLVIDLRTSKSYDPAKLPPDDDDD